MVNKRRKFTQKKMCAKKKRNIVLSGTAESFGIGAMTNERWKSFYEMMRDQKLYPEELNYLDAFSLQFVNSDKWIDFEKKY